jgi:hypothetical protein
MLFICAKPDLRLSDDDEASLPAEVEAWASDLAARGIRLVGHVFEPISDAKTIRRRDDDLQVVDGEMPDAEEPIAGFNLLECDSAEEAIELAAQHPMAKHGSLLLRAIAA